MAKRLSHWFAAIATLLSAGAVIYLLLGGSLVRFATFSGRSVLERDSDALPALIAPLVIAAAGLFFAWRDSAWGLWNVALLLSTFVIIAGFSIGLAYLPAALVMFLAAGLATAAKVAAA